MYIISYFMIVMIGTFLYGKVIYLCQTPAPPITNHNLANSLRNCSFVLGPLWSIYVCGLIAFSVSFGMMYGKDEFVWLIWFRFIFSNITFSLYYGLVFIAVFRAFCG